MVHIQLSRTGGQQLQHKRDQYRRIRNPVTCLQGCDVPPIRQKVLKGVLGGLVGASLFIAQSGPSFAFKEKVAEFDASGFIFKDAIEVVALQDPEIKGVTVYISDFKRSLTERLSKDFFADPSQTSVTCAITGPIDQAALQKFGGSSGQEIFSEQKGFNIFKNKTVRVRRVYDDSRNTLVYVSYSTRNTGSGDEGGPTTGRYRSSLCALPLPSSVRTIPTLPPENIQ
eukprot:TRINITY_DN3738_c0_g1_i1.p1 TRINITY_DN3738_c0_g1~~TRINITY_DN3738_c0_g1_i1.p1  ORF type:complete len:227 (-),score=36.18 TRINITY_DN3738_c0_g1_i1:714-1394(-)